MIGESDRRVGKVIGEFDRRVVRVIREHPTVSQVRLLLPPIFRVYDLIQPVVDS